jgi:hypothetical protein
MSDETTEMVALESASVEGEPVEQAPVMMSPELCDLIVEGYVSTSQLRILMLALREGGAIMGSMSSRASSLGMHSQNFIANINAMRQAGMIERIEGGHRANMDTSTWKVRKHGLYRKTG